jgi:hypothetical protein
MERCWNYTESGMKKPWPSATVYHKPSTQPGFSVKDGQITLYTSAVSLFIHLTTLITATPSQLISLTSSSTLFHPCFGLVSVFYTREKDLF